MRVIIELKKVEQTDLQLFLSALSSYTNTMKILQETSKDSRKYSIEMSIAAETWYELQKKTLGQFPVQHTLIKLSLHKAFILYEALRNYAGETYCYLESSRCTRYLTAIDQQIPTPTQLALNQQTN